MARQAGDTALHEPISHRGMKIIVVALVEGLEFLGLLSGIWLAVLLVMICIGSVLARIDFWASLGSAVASNIAFEVGAVLFLPLGHLRKYLDQKWPALSHRTSRNPRT